MQEGLVRKVVAQYLKENSERFRLQTGSGPDILKEGGAVIEVKGTQFTGGLGEVLKQLAVYAFSHADLELALPYDAISLELIHGLLVIENAIAFRTPGRERRIGVFLVGEVHLPSVEEGTYGVFKFNSATELYGRVRGELESNARLPYDTPTEKAIERTAALAVEVGKRLKDWLRIQCIESSWSYKVILKEAGETR